MYRPSYEVCAEFFSYDAHTGIITWAKSPHRRIKAGAVAGSQRPDKYRRVNFKGGVIASHRLAWLLHYGQWPEGDIDHINRIRDDNRITNLRVVTAAENAANREYRKPGQMRHSGTGISYNARLGKWQVQVHSPKLGKPVYGGVFLERTEALLQAQRMRMEFDL